MYDRLISVAHLMPKTEVDRLKTSIDNRDKTIAGGTIALDLLNNYFATAEGQEQNIGLGKFQAYTTLNSYIDAGVEGTKLREVAQDIVTDLGKKGLRARTREHTMKQWKTLSTGASYGLTATQTAAVAQDLKDMDTYTRESFPTLKIDKDGVVTSVGVSRKEQDKINKLRVATARNTFETTKTQTQEAKFAGEPFLIGFNKATEQWQRFNNKTGTMSYFQPPLDAEEVFGYAEEPVYDPTSTFAPANGSWRLMRSGSIWEKSDINIAGASAR